MGAIYYLLAVCLIKEAGECHYAHGGFFAPAHRFQVRADEAGAAEMNEYTLSFSVRF